MTRISNRHPRYRSLQTRARLARALADGVVVGEGLIAQGRAEAFDYFLGERSTPSARRAERSAARWLAAAQRPVISVNGNVAALAAREVAALQRARPGLAVEVNLFHRTPARARAVADVLSKAGVRGVLGVRPTARVPGLPSDRAWVDRRGIGRADLCLVPLEDGDRALALRRMGKRVIAIDLNPMSRTAEVADLPVVDELTRALRAMVEELRRGRRAEGPGGFEAVDAPRLLAEARRTMALRLTRSARRPGIGGSARGASSRPARGIGSRRRRTPRRRSHRRRPRR